jgi:hypothetical protein
MRARVRETIAGVSEDVSADLGDFRIDPRDFLSARERGEATGTRIEQRSESLGAAAEIVNRSFPEMTESGRFINVISPVVVPNRQSLFWRLLPIGFMILFGLLS